MKQIKTMAGVILNSKGEVLCTLRDQGKFDYVSFKWEFPGGKVEEGESPKQTLARELREELDIEVEIGDFFYQVEHDYPDFHLSMTIFKCKYEGEKLSLNVHKDTKWLNPKDIMSLDWAAADLPVAQEIYNKIYLNSIEK